MKFFFLVFLIFALPFINNAQNALNFDGVNDQITTTQPGITGSNSRTIEAWIKMSSTTSTSQHVIVDMGATTTTQRFTFNIINGKNLRIEYGGNGFTYTTINLNDNTWHHVAVTYNQNNVSGQKCKLYIDGINVMSQDFTGTPNTAVANIFIGVRIDGVNSFAGSMDEVRVWNVERTAAQILADKDHEFCSNPVGLIGYFKFNEGVASGTNTSITTVLNSVTPTNSATLSGFSLTGSTSNFVTGAPVTTSGTVTSTINPISCTAYTSPANNTYTTTGVYYDTIPSIGGCDSIITINLTIGSAPVASLTANPVGSTTATLQWPPVAGAVSYEYVLDQSSLSPTGAGTNTTDTFYLATSLSPSATYFMHVRVSCGGSFSTWVNQAFTTPCQLPVISSITDSFNCGPGTVDLMAATSSNATLKWYNVATGGVAIGTGNSFVTPSISSTTNYYVEASKFAPAGVAGRNDYTGISQVIPNNTGQGIQFNVLTPLILDSVSVWVVSDTGTIIVQLQNTSNTVLSKDTFSFSGSGATTTSRVKIFLPVNYSLSTGNSYKILAFPGTTVSLSREGSVNPPFTTYGLSNVISLVSSWVNGAANTTNYYYFYNLYVSVASCISPRQMVTATIKPKPIVNLGNDTTICSGSTIILDAANPAGTYLWNSLESTQTITINDSDTYFVKVTDTNNCSSSDTIKVTPGIVPVNNLLSNYNLCQNDSLTLDAGNLGSAFLWDNTTTNQTRTVNSGGNYNVIITSPDECTLVSNTTVTMRSLPIVHLGNDTAICMNDAITLDAGNLGSTYAWNTGVNTQTILINAANTYSVFVTSPYGCIASDEITVTNIPEPTIEGFNFIDLYNQQLGKVQFTAINPQNVVSYDWDFGDGSPHSASVSPIHVYATRGVFTVTLKASNPCSETTISLTIYAGPVGISKIDPDSTNLALYPNPSKNEIIIETNDQNMLINEISITNVFGVEILHKNNLKISKQFINVAQLPSGIYQARVNTNKGWTVKKFEVVK